MRSHNDSNGTTLDLLLSWLYTFN